MFHAKKKEISNVKQLNHKNRFNEFSCLEYEFDFFNYAGIHRPVVLYTVPR